MGTKKAQISIEFIFVIGIILFLFLILISFYFNRLDESRKIETYVKLRSECLKISNLISSIYNNGDGAYIDIKTDYVISVSGNGTITVNPRDLNNEYTTKLAYYNCHNNEGQLEPILDQNFVFTNYSEDHCAGSNLNLLLSEVDLFDVIFLEDSHMEGNLSALDNFVFNGGIAVISEHVIKGDSTQNPILFGVDLKNNLKKCKYPTGEKCKAEVIKKDPRYDLNIGTILEFADSISIKDENFNYGMSNIEYIANFTDESLNVISKSAIVTWSYGLGQVSFFPDFVELTSLDFPPIVIGHIDQLTNLKIDPNNEALCTYISNIEATKFTGDIRIRNEKGGILIE